MTHVGPTSRGIKSHNKYTASPFTAKVQYAIKTFGTIVLNKHCFPFSLLRRNSLIKVAP